MENQLGQAEEQLEVDLRERTRSKESTYSEQLGSEVLDAKKPEDLS